MRTRIIMALAARAVQRMRAPVIKVGKTTISVTSLCSNSKLQSLETLQKEGVAGNMEREGGVTVHRLGDPGSVLCSATDSL